MTLPTFRSLAHRRQEKSDDAFPDPAPTSPNGNTEIDSDRTLTPTYTPHVDVKLATKTRKIWIIISSLLFTISVVFLILTIIGNINTKPVIRSTYIYRLDLTNIIPSTAEDITFVNSLARSLGLHDFYQVGLWSFCEGYNTDGITYCSPPQALYWFNPVEILLNELLAGATIALPAQVSDILTLIRIASHIMFGFFIVGVCMNFLSIFLAPIALYSRWWSFPLTFWTFTAALLTTAAAIIASVMAIVFKTVLTSQNSLNIGASIGTDMFAFMWIGAGCSVLGFVIHLAMGCCCASRRDVRSGRRRGRKSAYGITAAAGVEIDEKRRTKPAGSRLRMPVFGRRKTAAEVV